ncbi:unnamed protein product [Ceratitis capitata]|uniref:(Mediterranean fruit fly) hypothetical protein n=1 Tax=Ceratitis capitata TaxID=7213 RepID=A0A811UPP0_CERCA|nr:unnamed protein product [Ceratitis capitata]
MPLFPSVLCFLYFSLFPYTIFGYVHTLATCATCMRAGSKHPRQHHQSHSLAGETRFAVAAHDNKLILFTLSPLSFTSCIVSVSCLPRSLYNSTLHYKSQLRLVLLPFLF